MVHDKRLKPHPLPKTTVQWFHDIQAAIADARKARPYGILIGHRITEADLFHLAPHVCLKFRGCKPEGREAKRVIETALANYVANSDKHGLKSRPVMAFVLCYVGAHLALDLLNEQEAEAILDYCEEHLGEQ